MILIRTWSGIEVKVPLHNGSTAIAGEKIDLKKAPLIMLERDGDDDQVRILC